MVRAAIKCGMENCPVRDVLDRIGDQWSILILEELDGKTVRFNELLRSINDISRQMLSRTLKRLECDGYIHRELYPEIPPRTEYSLTPLGKSLLGPVQGLVTWAKDHHEEIRAARLKNATLD